MKVNNKGFTLIELIATIVILALVMTIGSFSITAIIKNSKEKEYSLLLKEINNAVEIYYQECRYADSDNAKCFYDFDLDGDVAGQDAVVVKKCVDSNYENSGVEGLSCKHVEKFGDIDNNGSVNEDDAEYLLFYSFNGFFEGFSVVDKKSFFTSLDILVDYGYLKGNFSDSDSNMKLINPKTGNDISGCVISIKYDGKFIITNEGSMNGTDVNECPTTEDYS